MFLTDNMKTIMLLEALLSCSLIIIMILIYHNAKKRSKLKELLIDIRDTNPVEYYQNIAPMQSQLTNLFVLALCEQKNNMLSVVYTEEVFTNKDDVDLLCDKLNESNNETNRYWTVIQYESPINTKKEISKEVYGETN